MTNKDKIKMSINKDFNKDNSYYKIIHEIEKAEKMKYKNCIFKWSFVSICLIAIIGGILFVNLKNDNIILENYIDEEKNIKLNINNLKNVGLLSLDADIKEISTNGINILWPEVLKDGITIPKELDKYNTKAIYTKKDMNSNYDILNCYVYNYFNEYDSDYKNIRIAFSDVNKPIRDYFFSEDESEDTIINGIKLKIYKYNDVFFVEFSYEKYNFDIETTNITEEELVELLLSIIK